MAQERTPDWRIAELAKAQYGVLTVSQLRDAGVGDSAIAKRCRAGRLHRIHRGVYAVGHLAPSEERGWIAAVLALGPGAVLSHQSAAALWRLLPPRSGPADVSVPGRSGRQKRLGIRIHRPRSLHARETTVLRGIPVTSPARTIADLQGVTAERDLRRAIRQAEVLGLETGLKDRDGTRSELERQFLRLCRRHRIPPPKVNVRVGPLTVDFLWRRHRLVVETDGYRYHRGRQAFEDDRARDLELQARGFEVMRLSHRQVFDDERGVVAALRAVLGRVSQPREQ